MTTPEKQYLKFPRLCFVCKKIVPYIRREKYICSEQCEKKFNKKIKLKTTLRCCGG
jgi:predicted nucleic acid-binding Zn ribbon protein